MKIAVIGSGIAGLSATWFLGSRHEVTLYERGRTLGMDAHTAEVEGRDGAPVQINVPMRVFFREYYPTLTALYEALGIAFEPVQYSGAFSTFGGPTYFRYRNHWWGSKSFSFLAGASLFSPRAIRLGAEILRFFSHRRRRAADRSLASLSLSQYLQREGYSKAFAEDFLYPTFAGICTCSYQSVQTYPAAMICDYLDSGLVGSRVNRLVNGTRDAATRMAAAARQQHFDMTLKSIELDEDGVNVSDGQGHEARYDHIILATQANQARRLLPASCERERRLLADFRYEKSQVVVHRDAALAPVTRAEWAPVNFMLSAEHDKPMASIWMNRIHPELEGQPDVFETWNPFVEPSADQTLLTTEFERPVVTRASLASLNRLQQMQEEPGRRVWFTGSYASTGIPLLESAAAASRRIAEQLDALDPGSPTPAPRPRSEVMAPVASPILDG